MDGLSLWRNLILMRLLSVGVWLMIAIGTIFGPGCRRRLWPWGSIGDGGMLRRKWAFFDFLICIIVSKYEIICNLLDHMATSQTKLLPNSLFPQKHRLPQLELINPMFPLHPILHTIVPYITFPHFCVIEGTDTSNPTLCEGKFWYIVTTLTTGVWGCE